VQAPGSCPSSCRGSDWCGRGSGCWPAGTSARVWPRLHRRAGCRGSDCCGRGSGCLPAGTSARVWPRLYRRASCGGWGTGGRRNWLLACRHVCPGVATPAQTCGRNDNTFRLSGSFPCQGALSLQRACDRGDDHPARPPSGQTRRPQNSNPDRLTRSNPRRDRGGDGAPARATPVPHRPDGQNQYPIWGFVPDREVSPERASRPCRPRRSPERAGLSGYAYGMVILNLILGARPPGGKCRRRMAS
jgi:hypothetical protein